MTVARAARSETLQRSTPRSRRTTGAQRWKAARSLALHPERLRSPSRARASAAQAWSPRSSAGGETAGEKRGGCDADRGQRDLADDVAALLPEMEKQVLPRETRQRGARRAARRIPALAFELAVHQGDDPGRARAEAELLVEPPGAGVEGLVVAVAQLIGKDREGGSGEDEADRGQYPGIDLGRFDTAERLEDVESDLRRAEERAVQDIARRYAVLERQKGVDGLEQEAALGTHAEDRELQAVLPGHQSHVLGAAVGEGVEVAAAGDHGVARQLEDALGTPAGELLDRQRAQAAARHLLGEIGASPPERCGVKVSRRSGEPLAGARRSRWVRRRVERRGRGRRRRARRAANRGSPCAGAGGRTRRQPGAASSGCSPGRASGRATLSPTRRSRRVPAPRPDARRTAASARSTPARRPRPSRARGSRESARRDARRSRRRTGSGSPCRRCRCRRAQRGTPEGRSAGRSRRACARPAREGRDRRDRRAGRSAARAAPRPRVPNRVAPVPACRAGGACAAASPVRTRRESGPGR